MSHHLTNWDLLWFSLGGYALCWVRRDWRLTRLARRCRHHEWQWRIERDDRLKAEAQRDFYQRELELADIEIVDLRSRTPGLGQKRAHTTGHPSVASRRPNVGAHK